MIIIGKNGYGIFESEEFIKEDGQYFIDNSTENGKLLFEKYITNYPFVEFEHDGEFITKIIVLDKPIKPVEIDGKQIELIIEEGIWKYVYLDIPKTEMEIQKDIINMLGQQLTDVKIKLLLGGM